MTRSRRLRKILLYLLVQLLALAAVLEIGLRFAGPRHRTLRALLHHPPAAADYARVDTLPRLMALTSLGFRPFEVDYGYVLNSRSLRTREYRTAKAPDVYRVVALGDSFVYGVVPEADHWATHLESGLAKERGGEVEMLRLGVPATGVPFQVRLWQIEGVLLAPDLVVSTFFMGNDFLDELEEPRLRQRLLRTSHSLRLARNLRRLLRGLEQGKATRERAAREPRESGGYELDELTDYYDETRPSFSAEAYRAVEAQRMELLAEDRRGEFEAQLAKVAEHLETLHREVTASGARLVVLLVPDEFQVDPEVRAEALAHAGRSEADFNLDLPQRRLGEVLSARGIEHVDVLPDFRRRALEERLYLLRDSHWNRAGNRRAAQLLLRHLGAAGGISPLLE